MRKIPYGRVATYGLLSTLMQGRLSAAAVGWAMRTAPADCPWHRVINSKGGISTGAESAQRERLASEGVRFRKDGTVDLQVFQWRPRAPNKRRHTGL